MDDVIRTNLESLLIKADQAQKLKAELELMLAWDSKAQKEIVSVDLWRKAREGKIPEESQIWELLESGRQTRITRLTDQLTSLLSNDRAERLPDDDAIIDPASELAPEDQLGTAIAKNGSFPEHT